MNSTKVTRPTRQAATDMSPFHDDAQDKRTVNGIIKHEEARGRRMEALLAKNAANVNDDGEIDILWAI